MPLPSTTSITASPTREGISLFTPTWTAIAPPMLKMKINTTYSSLDDVNFMKKKKKKKKTVIPAGKSNI